MNKGLFKVIAVSGLLAAAGSVQAEDDGLGIGVGARYSTLGTGVELGKSFSDYFSVRLGMNQYSQSDSLNIDSIKYDTDFDLKSTSLMLDWNPFGGSFHLTAGYLNSNNKLSASATPLAGSTVTIGSTPYTVTNTGDIVLDSGIALGSGPYVGLGWGNVPASGFGFTFEAGVVQMGTPDVNLKLSGNDAVGIAILEGLGEVNAEIDRMESDLNQFDIYPVVAVGISYGF